MLSAIGACRPDWQELDSVLMRSSIVYTDNRDACLKESGDIVLSEVSQYPLTHLLITLYSQRLLASRHAGDISVTVCMFVYNQVCPQIFVRDNCGDDGDRHVGIYASADDWRTCYPFTDLLITSCESIVLGPICPCVQ